MNKSSLLCCLVFALGAASATFSQRQVASQSQMAGAKTPAEINVVLEVVAPPGGDLPGTFWEGSYEIAVADWSEVIERTKAGTLNAAGEVLIQSSFEHRKLTKDGRILRITIPVKGILRERMNQEPARAQGFLLRSKIRVYDAKLDHDYIFDLNRVWQSRLFPDGEAKITISVKPDGSYSTLGPLPAQLPPEYTIINRSGNVPSHP